MILGIDPGAKGALAVLDPEGPSLVAVESMPSLNQVVAGRQRRQVDVHRLAGMIREDRELISYAIIEEVHSMPKQGVASTFAFGRAAMAPEAILAALQVPTILASPRKWKAVMQVGADKDETVKRANQLFPDQTHFWHDPRRKHTDHNKAEAALIALYGLRTLGKDIGGET